MKKDLIIGHTSCLLAYTIFGFNIIVTKALSSDGGISPLGLFCFRAMGATILFWIASFFTKEEKMEKKDMLKTFVASMLGLYITQMCFLKAMTITTAIDASIITSLSPIMTMIIAYFYLGEPITSKKLLGVAISFIGVIILILNSVSISEGPSKTHPLGAILMVGNGLAFALYLGLFRPLISKYNVITFMKWMFLFASIASIPFNIHELSSINYANLPIKTILEICFIILFSTFIAYFLIPIGQKLLRPTLVSMYSYIQPIVATLISIYFGLDSLSVLKIAAATCVFAGVAIVNASRTKSN